MEAEGRRKAHWLFGARGAGGFPGTKRPQEDMVSSAEGCASVEPDILLTCGDRTVVVEVKWHASLSDRQIEKQIAAVRASGEHGKVVASLMLGLGRWLRQVEAFLAQTDMNRVFGGLPMLPPVGPIAFRFSKPGHPPWFLRDLPDVPSANYTFGEAT